MLAEEDTLFISQVRIFSIAAKAFVNGGRHPWCFADFRMELAVQKG